MKSLRLRELSSGPNSDANTFPIDAVWQQFASSSQNRPLHSRSRLRIDEQSHASAASGSADFTRECTLLPRGGDHAVNYRRRNRGQIPAPKLPLLADEPAGLAPVVSIERNKKLTRHVRNARKVAKDFLIALNMPGKNLPIVDAVLPRLACVAKNKPPFQFVEVASNFCAPFASGFQMNRAGAAKRRRIMVLRSRRHADHDRLRVAADVDPIFQSLSRAREPIERSANGYGHGA